ncbi:hypothetical protein SLS62_004104 [Diatrype stigma]|uniref:Uncharacterized protein n=1 Tax=Diatrype stigma TaxID=117547 RepID=A0AAN9US01_9PEZI
MSRDWDYTTEGGANQHKPSPPPSTSTDYDYGPHTPTGTSVDDIYPGPTALVEVVPWPGSTFVIRERVTRRPRRAITLVMGGLQLKDWNCPGDQSSHWICEEKDGWLGFHSPVADKYIGHDNKRGFWAEARQHKDWEYFCARRHPEGGYVLLIKRSHTLSKMGVAHNGGKLVETTGEGAVWDFVKL